MSLFSSFPTLSERESSSSRLKCRLGARFYVTSAGFLKYLPNSKVSFGSMCKVVSEANVDRSTKSERKEPLQVTLYCLALGLVIKRMSPFSILTPRYGDHCLIEVV